MAVLTTAQLLAISVLQGDETALRPLLDELIEQGKEGGVRLPPVNKITVTKDRLRVIIYVGSDDVEIDRASLDQAVKNWLSGKAQWLGLVGVDRVEIYELPEKF